MTAVSPAQSAAFSPARRPTDRGSGSTPATPEVDALLLETGDELLLETGDELLLEDAN